MTNSDIKETESRLNAIARLRLLFSTTRELNDFICFKADGNNSLSRIGGENAFLKNAVYDTLCHYADDLTGVDFNGFLDAYRAASEFYSRKNLKWLARKHFTPCAELIRYVYGGVPSSSIYDKVLVNLLPEIYSEDDEQQIVNVPILILLGLGLLPLYSGGRGDVADIHEDFNALFAFLQPVMDENTLFARNQTLEQWKTDVATDKSITGRFLLYVALTDILDNYTRCTNHAALYLSNLDFQKNIIYPMGDTLWRESETAFWLFKALDNGYFATRYQIIESSRRVEYIRYEMVMFTDEDTTHAYVIDPRGSMNFMRGKKMSDNEFEIFEVKTFEGGSGRVMNFTSTTHTNCLELHSLTETEITFDEFQHRYRNCTFIDRYPKTSYRCVSQIAAITPEHIFIPDGAGCFYKIPKKLASVLRQADVTDNIGLFEISATEEKVVGFVDQGLYLNVTYPSVYEKQGIRLTNAITAD